MKTRFLKKAFLGMLFLIGLNSHSQLIITETHVDPLCDGVNNGSIDILVSGGTPPYSFFWETSDSSISPSYEINEDQNNLSSGTYTVTVNDMDSNTQTTSIILTDITNIIITNTFVQRTSCYGSCDGSIGISVAGGTPEYNYLWSNGESGSASTINGLCEGDYFVTIFDSQGCIGYSGEIPYAVIEPENINLGLSSVSGATNGICNGQIETFGYISGGTPPYTFNWDNDNFTQNIYDLCPGTYNLTLIDAADCFYQESFIVGSSYDGVYSFVDTLNLVIDTCIFDNINPVDSALIYDYNLIGTDSIQLNWIFWQAGSSITLDITVFLETTGSNLVYLEIICNGSKSINSATTYNFYSKFDTETAGLKEFENTNFSVYPNPTNGQLTIEADHLKQVEIYNLSGVLMVRTSRPYIDLSALAKGVYFVKIVTINNTVTKKILLE